MTSYFCGQNKELWGFSVKSDGTYACEISKFTADAVKKIIDYYYESNWEIHVAPNHSPPLIMLNDSVITWYYFQSESDAEKFKESIRTFQGDK